MVFTHCLLSAVILPNSPHQWVLYVKFHLHSSKLHRELSAASFVTISGSVPLGRHLTLAVCGKLVVAP